MPQLGASRNSMELPPPASIVRLCTNNVNLFVLLLSSLLLRSHLSVTQTSTILRGFVTPPPHIWCDIQCDKPLKGPFLKDLLKMFAPCPNFKLIYGGIESLQPPLF